jgi:Rps23 Pro-64 3,4-dihydroxylase Tpa1-like proline 4-hydroxylase
MSREIKFRVWDKSHKQFLPLETYNIHSRTSFGSFGIMRKDWNNYSEGEYFYDNSQVLEQFTGLKDKNGVDIYEGDKLHCLGCDYKLIKHDSGAYELHEVGSDKVFFLFKESYKIEVIGNIHENK